MHGMNASGAYVTESGQRKNAAEKKTRGLMLTAMVSEPDATDIGNKSYSSAVKVDLREPLRCSRESVECSGTGFSELPGCSHGQGTTVHPVHPM